MCRFAQSSIFGLDCVRPMKHNGAQFRLVRETGFYFMTKERKERPGGLKPRSIAKKRLSRKEMEEGKALLPDMDFRRPKSRADCRDGIRPCPFVGCRYHLYLDIHVHTGTMKLNFPGLELWEMPFTCALDVAEMGGRTLEEVGQILNMTRERVRQLEFSALRKIRKEIERLDGNEVADDEAVEEPDEEVPVEADTDSEEE